MAHLLSCRLLDEACTADDLATVTERAKACARKWEKIVRRTRQKKKKIGRFFLDISFQSSSAPCHSSPRSATITKSSAYIIFLRASVLLIFLLISSIIKMKNNGLRALPCLKPMFTWSSFGIPDPTTTLPLWSHTLLQPFLVLIMLLPSISE